ncbi:MAG: phage holin family protein [Chloroflexi bacterium]|nr:phage holin family protein [Chloroflexota bacterium]
MQKLIVRLIINAVALGASAFLIDGIHYGSITDLLIVAALFGIVNAVIKPVIKLLTCPFVALTLGIFILVINALMLWLTGELAQGFGVNFTVANFGSAFFGALIVSVVSIILNIFVPGDMKR